jgi:hypothetical protein
MAISNRDIVRAFNSDAALRFKHRHLTSRAAEIAASIAELDEMFAFVDRVTEIHDGVALEIIDNSVICVLRQSVWAKVIEENNAFAVVGWLDGISHDLALCFHVEDAIASAKAFVVQHSQKD